VAYEYGAKEPEKLKIKDMTPTEKAFLIGVRYFLYAAVDASACLSRR
jgi:hypothetical protein